MGAAPIFSGVKYRGNLATNEEAAVFILAPLF